MNRTEYFFDYEIDLASVRLRITVSQDEKHNFAEAEIPFYSMIDDPVLLPSTIGLMLVYLNDSKLFPVMPTAYPVKK